jgi:signal transduction histidine kinase/ligand-binding sensor domain-containing protein/DNA-binding response OmpR family regulator
MFMQYENKKTINCLLVIILFLINSFPLLSFSQSGDAKFIHLTTSDGLSQSSVFSILKDYKGFMWFATDEGLNKYDGYKFTVYKHDPENQSSISGNSVNGLLEDSAHNLWIASAGGLDKFDRISESFIHYRNKETGIAIKNIFLDSKQRMWLATTGGFCLFNRQKATFKFYKNDKKNLNSLSHDYVYKITEDNYGELWIGTRDGLNRFNPETEKFIRYQADVKNSRGIGPGYIKSVYKDSKGNIWIGTQGSGVALYNRRDNSFINYRHHAFNENSVCYNDILSFAEDTKGRLWIGTENGGISVFDYSKNKFESFKNNENDPFSISGNSVYSLYKDDIGNIWAGTWSGGVNLLRFSGDKFIHYKKIPNNSNSLSNNLVLSIFGDSDNNIWIGTDGGGLNRFDTRTHQFTNYRNKSSSNKSIGSDYVLSITEYSPGILALGFHRGGIDLFDVKKQLFTHYAPETNAPGKLSTASVNTVCTDRQNNLWAGTYNNGALYSFNNNSKTFSHYFSDPKDGISDTSITVIYETKAGQLWTGGDKGLDQFDITTKKFIHHQHDPKNKQSISNNIVESIKEDAEGNLWLGTRGGLNYFNLKTGNFTAYTEKDGLPNNTVWSTQQDRHGNIWISTNKGLSIFNPSTKVFKNYTVTDGLQSNSFKGKASWQSPTGEMYFGGVNGFNVFHPDSIKDNDFIPPVYLTDFQIFNKPVGLGKNAPLKQSVNEVKEITLSYKQSVFTIEFAALNFTQPERNNYAYKLEGFDREWIKAGTKRSATYTNLNAGEYIFKVKGSNNDGIWNEEGTAVKITIMPPFWLTWWFKLAAVLAVIGGIIGFYRFRMNSIKIQKRKLEHKVHQQTQQLLLSAKEEKKARQEADEANKAKSVFLATMSHEIRTPMNGVIGMASLLNETELTSEQREYARTISTCGDALLAVINDILDFSKIESGNMELEERDFNLRTCIEDVLDIFAEKAGRLGLDLVYEIDHNVPEQIIGDSLRLRQVLINLVSNAIKFTEQGEIFLRVHLLQIKHSGQIELQFEVSDTGIGIAEDKLERLFKAFSQVDSSTTRKYGGTGLGLIISEKLIKLMGGKISVTSKDAKGTTFTFNIACAVSSLSLRTYVTGSITGIEGQKILIVDDNLTNRIILKNQMEMWKLIPALASSAKEALEIMKQNMNFDLLLTDMQMPGMGGCEFAGEVKKMYPGLPIILLSSLGDERNKLCSNLFNAVLTKPVKQELLCRQIVNELRGKTKTAHQPEPEKQKLSADFANTYPLKILVAEDNLINQNLILKILSKLGYTAALAVHGKEAAEMAAQQECDLILMDVQMPEMDGLEATRTIRKQPFIQPVIIAMTANVMKEDKEECLHAGMDDFLSKPVKPEHVMNMLIKYCRVISENKKKSGQDIRA